MIDKIRTFFGGRNSIKSKQARRFDLLRSLMAIAIAMAVALILIFLISDNPGNALVQMLIRPLISSRKGVVSFNLKSFLEILARMVPTTLAGLAVCVMFSANQFNLAAEGCVMLGGFASALCAIYLDMPGWLHPIVCILVAMIVCGATMLIPAVLGTTLGANVMVSSLMLNYIIMYVVGHFLNNHLADRNQGAVVTYPFKRTAILGKLVQGEQLSSGILIALVMAVIVAIFMYRTRWGYTIRMIGINREFSKYSGIRVSGMIILAQVIGGAVAGMGGAVETLGFYDRFKWRSLPGYGWTGITIAILAKNNPAYVPIAAFFLAYLERGCTLMMTFGDVPSEMIQIIQAVIFLFFAAENLLAGYRQRVVVKVAQDEISAQDALLDTKGAQA